MKESRFFNTEIKEQTIFIVCNQYTDEAFFVLYGKAVNVTEKESEINSFSNFNVIDILEKTYYKTEENAKKMVLSMYGDLRLISNKKLFETKATKNVDRWWNNY